MKRWNIPGVYYPEELAAMKKPAADAAGEKERPEAEKEKAAALNAVPPGYISSVEVGRMLGYKTDRHNKTLHGILCRAGVKRVRVSLPVAGGLRVYWERAAVEKLAAERTEKVPEGYISTVEASGLLGYTLRVDGMAERCVYDKLAKRGVPSARVFNPSTGRFSTYWERAAVEKLDRISRGREIPEGYISTAAAAAIFGHTSKNHATAVKRMRAAGMVPVWVHGDRKNAGGFFWEEKRVRAMVPDTTVPPGWISRNVAAQMMRIHASGMNHLAEEKGLDVKTIFRKTRMGLRRITIFRESEIREEAAKKFAGVEESSAGLLTMREATALAGWSVPYLYKLQKEGRLTPRRAMMYEAGGRRRIMICYHIREIEKLKKI